MLAVRPDTWPGSVPGSVPHLNHAAPQAAAGRKRCKFERRALLLLAACMTLSSEGSQASVHHKTRLTVHIKATRLFSCNRCIKYPHMTDFIVTFRPAVFVTEFLFCPHRERAARSY